MKLRKLGITAAFLVGVAAQPAHAQLDLGWQTFFFGEATALATSFSISSANPFRVYFVDCCVIGDRFRFSIVAPSPVIADHASSAVNPIWNGVSSGCFDGDCAWADGRLSSGYVEMFAGSWSFEIWVIENAAGTSGGAGYWKAETVHDAGVVPEPSTYALMATGLLAVFGAARRRQRA